MTRGPLIWVLADERRGTAAQALGVAEALGLPYETKAIHHSALARLPNALVGATLVGLSGESRAALRAPWPDLVIAAGRRAGAAARWIKKRSGGRSRLVQVMHPGTWGAADFDLIAAPRHDLASGANVLPVTGAPHLVTQRVLEEAAAAWRERFATFPRPVTALLLGGATRRRGFGEAEARALGAEVARAVLASRGSFALTSSPRSGAAFDNVLAGAAAAGAWPVMTYRWGCGTENPYLAFLALADALVVTGDSVSMLSEACAGTKPVYIYAPPGFTTSKHERLHEELLAGGYLRPLGPRIESWTHPPLNAAAEIAAEIRRRFVPLFGDQRGDESRA